MLFRIVLLVPLVLFGCGQSGILNKDITYNATKEGAPGNVIFSHKLHVKVKGQHCSYCHPKPFKKKAGMTKFSMKEIWEGKFCGKCHNGSKAFSAKETDNCVRCHKGRK